jgi:AcrR family transcriptional regulator
MIKSINKRSLNSKLKIGSGLVNILLNKKLQDVTVCELEKESHISRSTFYRNFSNVYDVLSLMMDYYYCQYILNVNNKDNKLEYFFKYWEDKKDLLYVISQDNQEILENTIMKYDNISRQDAKIKCLLFFTFIKIWYEAYPNHNYYKMVENTNNIFNNFKLYI